MKFSTVEPLVHELLQLVAAHRSAFGQERVYRRAQGLVLAQLLAFGRHTITQLLLVLGLGEQDWSAWYRLFSHGRFNDERAARCLLGELLNHVPPTEWLVVGVDGVHLPRHSRRMPGSSWSRARRTAPWQAGIERTQRYLHLAWLLPQERGFSRALPLRWLAAFPPAAVAAAVAPRTVVVAALEGLTWLRGQLDARDRAAQPLLVVADGGFETVAFWRGLPARCVAVARTAKNRRLYTLPAPEPRGRGRRRQYGPRLPPPAELAQSRRGWKQLTLRVRGRTIWLRYQVVGLCLRRPLAERPFYLILVGGARYEGSQGRERRRRPRYYLVNALQDQEGQWQLPLAVETLLSWLWQRWELEVAHRELKSSWGIGQSQCWHALGTILAVQFAVWSYALLLLAGYRRWGLLGGPPAPARWWRGAKRWSFDTLWRAFRAELGGPRELQLLWTPSPGNWYEKERLMHAVENSILASVKT